MKTLTAMGLVLVWLAVALPCAAGDAKQDESVGQKIGKTTRQIVDESKKAFHDIKDAGKETGKQIYQGAKKGAKAAKETGKEVAREVKNGFKKGGNATETQKEPKEK